MKIDNKIIGNNHIFVIAEIGNNHNGDVNAAIELIDIAKDAGVDCVKFQMRNMQEVYTNRSLKKDGQDLGTEYILDLLERFELSNSQHKKIVQYCQSKDITYLCTPWDIKSVDILESLNLPAFKVASADLTNIPLLDRLLLTKKPLIISTGMSTENEIIMTTNHLKSSNSEFALLHCNSTYPAPFHDINLNWLSRLKIIHPMVGYSGHERGTSVSLAAVALGAKIIERHITLDRRMEGPDHAASLEKKELTHLLEGIRELEAALGTTNERHLSQGEMINRENLSKSIVANCHLNEGTIIKKEHLKIRSPGQGLSAQYYHQLLGKKINRDIKEEDFFYKSDINGVTFKPKAYSFNRPWGIPVRFHDFEYYNSIIKPDIFEFHLSYTDMNLNINDFFKGPYPNQFVVHAPELFSKGRLMDLASLDEKYRVYSIEETQRVIDLTKKMKKFFVNCEKPMIVANIGGFTMDEILSQKDKNKCYKMFSKSLIELDLDGVELIPQTMAPFPWHFGGQRFQNLFVYAEESKYWCKKLNLRLCFDISHSKLMCNYFKKRFF